MSSALGDRRGIGRDDLEVLGAELVGHRDGVVEIVDQDCGALALQRGAHPFVVAGGGHLLGQGRLHRADQRRRRGDPSSRPSSVVAKVQVVRSAIGPLLSGLQSLPSVAWVPPAVLWLGLDNSMMYAVILLGATPSIANGLVSGIDQVPPLYLRAGRSLGATGLRGARHIVMPAA